VSAAGRVALSGRLRPYWAVLQARFRMLLQYRAAAMAGLVTQLFWGGIRMMAFDAFFRSSTAVQPMSYEQTVTYVWLIQALLLLLPMRLDGEIMQMIRTGNLVYELARPIDLYAYWYTRNIAGRVAPALLRATPMVIIAGLFLGLQAPASWASAGAFALSLVGAVALSAAITTLSIITVILTISGEGLTRLLMAVSWLLSGAILPLPLFPDWAQTVLNWLPFRGLMDIPFRLYCGDLDPGAVWGLLLHQVVWSLVFILWGRWMLSRISKRLVIQGG